jgi:hypothetical protein
MILTKLTKVTTGFHTNDLPENHYFNVLFVTMIKYVTRLAYAKFGNVVIPRKQ